MFMFTPERNLSTPGQCGHSSQRRTYTGTRNTVPQRANPTHTASRSGYRFHSLVGSTGGGGGGNTGGGNTGVGGGGPFVMDRAQQQGSRAGEDPYSYGSPCASNTGGGLGANTGGLCNPGGGGGSSSAGANTGGGLGDNTMGGARGGGASGGGSGGGGGGSGVSGVRGGSDGGNGGGSTGGGGNGGSDGGNGAVGLVAKLQREAASSRTDDSFTPERQLPPTGERGHSPQRRAAAPPIIDMGNTIPQRAYPSQPVYAPVGAMGGYAVQTSAGEDLGLTRDTGGARGRDTGGGSGGGGRDTGGVRGKDTGGGSGGGGRIAPIHTISSDELRVDPRDTAGEGRLLTGGEGSNSRPDLRLDSNTAYSLERALRMPLAGPSAAVSRPGSRPNSGPFLGDSRPGSRSNSSLIHSESRPGSASFFGDSQPGSRPDSGPEYSPSTPQRPRFPKRRGASGGWSAGSARESASDGLDSSPSNSRYCITII